MNNILDKLLEKLTVMKKENRYYLSLYYPVTLETRDEIDTNLKSFILKAIRRKKHLARKTRLHKNIVDKVLSEITSLTDLERGIGIFIGFNSSKQQHGRADEIVDVDFDMVTFSRKPRKEIFIGNIYSLDQLIWLENTNIEALVLNINESQCSIYLKEDNTLEELTTITNPFRTGGKDRNEEESVEKFVKEIRQYISSPGKIRVKYEYLVVLSSNSYQGFIKDNFGESTWSNEDFIPIFIDKNLSDPEEILNYAKIGISKSQKMKKRDRLEVIKENYSHYCEGWTESIKAINSSKVSTLFVKSVVKRKGYINIFSKQLFTYPKKDTHKIKNIVPWAIKSVIDNGGDIVILQGDNYPNAPEIAAELRYAKKRRETNNKKVLKKWVNERKGVPSIVSGTTDLLRIKFSSEPDLEEITWDKFFELLEQNNLLFIYDEEKDSKFCTFISKKS